MLSKVIFPLEPMLACSSTATAGTGYQIFYRRWEMFVHVAVQVELALGFVLALGEHAV